MLFRFEHRMTISQVIINGISVLRTFTAIGLAPFKDTFWTTKDQPGYANHGKPVNKSEWHPELEAAMATLSMGIVGISDKSI